MPTNFVYPITQSVATMAFSYTNVTNSASKGPFRRATNSDVTNSHAVADSSMYTRYMKNKTSFRK
uniref:Uncharacterized protein n=1 Tax=viral metagenome TaxID=1070528 RepID=A0A6C0LHQ4_9ZZZZ